jgi:CBS domain-containing protein
MTARDLASPTEAVVMTLPLLDAIRRLGALGVAALPVVDSATGRVLGTIGRAAIVARYGRSLEGITSKSP